MGKGHVELTMSRAFLPPQSCGSGPLSSEENGCCGRADATRRLCTQPSLIAYCYQTLKGKLNAAKAPGSWPARCKH